MTVTAIFRSDTRKTTTFGVLHFSPSFHLSFIFLYVFFFLFFTFFSLFSAETIVARYSCCCCCGTVTRRTSITFSETRNVFDRVPMRSFGNVFSRCHLNNNRTAIDDDHRGSWQFFAVAERIGNGVRRVYTNEFPATHETLDRSGGNELAVRVPVPRCSITLDGLFRAAKRFQPVISYSRSIRMSRNTGPLCLA